MAFSWSHTALKQFETCPRQYAEVRFYKSVKEEENEATLWGNRVHKEFEECISKPGRKMPPELAMYQPIVDKILSYPGKVYAEQKLAVTNQWTPTGWFAKDTWCRGIVDVLIVDGHKARMLDFKTGKQKDDLDQLRLFSALVFANFPHVSEIKAANLWLKNKTLAPKDFTVTLYEFDTITRMYDKAVSVVEEACQTELFQPKQSGLCKQWCPVVSCEFNGKRKL